MMDLKIDFTVNEGIDMFNADLSMTENEKEVRRQKQKIMDLMQQDIKEKVAVKSEVIIRAIIASDMKNRMRKRKFRRPRSQPKGEDNYKMAETPLKLPQINEILAGPDLPPSQKNEKYV